MSVGSWNIDPCSGVAALPLSPAETSERVASWSEKLVSVLSDLMSECELSVNKQVTVQRQGGGGENGTNWI